MDTISRDIGRQPWTLARAKAACAEFLNQIVVLFKLRVVALLLLASIGGALLASDGRLPIGRLALLLLTGLLSSGGASAINQYLERGKDGCMARTRNRPLAVGALSRPETVLEISVALIILAMMIALPFSLPLAFFLTAGAAIYVGVYTIWLKPRTWLNIIIGGAAGSCAVLSGSAAVGNWADPGALLLALIVFLWTPTHFWSLAQAYRDDYARAGVPMLPVIVSPRTSAWWILLHTSATALAAMLLGFFTATHWLYFLVTLPASVWLLWQSSRLVVNPAGRQALRLFKVSNIYLGFVLMAIYLTTLL